MAKQEGEQTKMAPNQQSEERGDTRQARQLVWYHDLKWSNAKLEEREKGLDHPIEARLKLSDGREATIRFKTPEQLGGLIASLERAI